MTPSEMEPIWRLMAQVSAIWLAIGAIPLLSQPLAPSVAERFLLWFVVPGTAGCAVAFIMLLII